MADYLIHDSTLEDIADAIRSKTGGSSLIEPEDMPTEIASISGGTEMTDGIVVKSRDANGFPTEIDVYGDLYDFQFSYDGPYYHQTIGWRAVNKVNLKTNQTKIPTGAFAYLPVTQITGTEHLVEASGGYCFDCCSNLTVVDFLPNLRKSGNNMFRNCSNLKAAYLPSLTYIKGTTFYSLFLECTALETVQIGSVGNGVTYIYNGFRGCSQAGLTITVYTTGSYADTVVTNIRNDATNATIIIKASEETTYNGTTYNAGDTILTSEVTS